MQQHLLLLKLTFRSWWRNKLFATISIISLTIGITCTNLLTTFIVNEYTIESSNPNGEQILRLTQEIPFSQKKKQGNFIYGGSTPQIVSGFPEILAYLRMCEKEISHIKVGEKEFSKQTVVCADSTFLQFFPFHTIYGNIKEALTKPGNIAISKNLAQLYFGKDNPIGRTISLISANKTTIVRVSAIFNRYPQTMLQADILTSLSNEEEGTSCMILLNEKIDRKDFQQRFEKTELPTLTGKGHYQVQTLQQSYFDTETSESIHSIAHRQKILPGIGLLSALLILFIACFNYVNLSFSRLLKQVKMIHVERLMGATQKSIRYQLFIDTFLTVLIAFILSLLLTNDLLPFFNILVSSYLTFPFVLSSQVFPLILLFVLILSTIPALYMSYKMQSSTIYSYQHFFTGRKKQWIISFLVIVQFIISIGLIFSFLIIREQLNMIESEGDRYKEVVELRNEKAISIIPMYNDMEKLPGIERISVSRNGIFGPWGLSVPTKGDTGEDILVSVYLYEESMDFLNFYDIKLMESAHTTALLHKVSTPILVNETFVRCFVSGEENPVGQPYNKFLKDDSAGKDGTIIGVFEDFKVMSFNESSFPMRVILRKIPDKDASTIVFKLHHAKDNETMEQVKQLWNKHYPNQHFACNDIYSIYMSYNQDVVNFSRLLLTYSLISLFLTAFGLFGIAWYAAEQRKREIGIRKVNGASTRQIIILLNHPFLIYILIAYAIAIPIVYCLMLKWLEQFVYRADIRIEVFIIPLLIMLIISIFTISINSWKSASINPVDVIKE